MVNFRGNPHQVPLIRDYEMGRDFNQTHPELKPGEVFVTNETLDKLGETVSRLNSGDIYFNARVGTQAYTLRGVGIPQHQLRPIFAFTKKQPRVERSLLVMDAPVLGLEEREKRRQS